MTIPKEAKISIRFTGWWLGGTGRTGGATLDMVAYRDRFHCPALPMTQVKGVLRETAEHHGLLTDEEIVSWFGRADDQEAQDYPAAIRFAGDAILPPTDHAYFAHTANSAALAALFSSMRATAINDAGVALDESLRTIEVVAPVTLERRVQWIGASAPPGDWVDKLDQLCAFTLAFGKLRNDGMGRAIAKAEAVQ